MLKNLVTFSTEIPEVSDMEINRTYMLTLADGLFRYKRTSLMLVKEQLESFDNLLVGLDKGSKGVKLLIPKVPFNLWLMSLDFFKDIFTKYGTEASSIIYYIHDLDEFKDFYENLSSKEKSSVLMENNFLIQAPLQVNEKLETNFGDCPLYSKLCENNNFTKVIELHSHHEMDTFWSNTDNRNQNEDCFYGVFGNIGTKDDFLMKYVIQGANVDISVDKLFDFPKFKVTTSYEVDKYKNLLKLDTKPKVKTSLFEGVYPNNSTYPKEWLNMVSNKNEKPSQDVRVINNKEVINTTNVDTLMYTLTQDIMSLINYRTLNTLQPENTDLSIYTEEENLKIMEYLLYSHRILAIDFILHFLNDKDYTDIEENFKEIAKRLENFKNKWMELGYLTKEDSNGMFNKFKTMINLTYLYFDSVDDTVPKLNVPHLADKYQISIAI